MALFFCKPRPSKSQGLRELGVEPGSLEASWHQDKGDSIERASNSNSQDQGHLFGVFIKQPVVTCLIWCEWNIDLQSNSSLPSIKLLIYFLPFTPSNLEEMKK